MAAAPAVFETQPGEKARFFLQAGLSDETKQELTREIERHGGCLTDKVPIQGFVVIDPRSSGGQRLVSRWRTPDKPGRRVVPTTFVRACILHNGILPPIFTRDSRPLRMHVDGSVEDQTVRDRAYERIWHSGGDPTTPFSDADVVLVAEDNHSMAAVRAEVAGMRPQPHVEYLGWVKQCANNGECRFSPRPQPNARKTDTKPSGKSGGRARNEYTPADDYELSKYIAHKFPDQTQPGRAGNKLYRDLCDDVETYTWAARHPWSSWREHYIKNRDSFDRRIKKYCEEHDLAPLADEDSTVKSKRISKKNLSNGSATNPDEGSSAGEDNAAPPEAKSPRKRRRATRKKAMPPEKLTPSPTVKAEEATEAELPPPPAPGPSQPLRRSPSRDSWGSQWEVRVAPEDDRPDWAKRGRKRSADEAAPDYTVPTKKARREEQQAPNSEPANERQVSHPPVAALPADDSVTEDSASLAEADAVDVLAQGPAAIAESTQTQDSSVATQSEALGETQQLLAAHNAIVAGRHASPPPIAGPSHDNSTHEIDAQLSQIAHKYRFYLQDVVTVYDNVNDLQKTEQVFGDMRKAADTVLHNYGF
ncbi:hypothetical protein AURDEDRAFT_156874 [Auricularia subglabra TFB-10046 SS5]|nr:hypothetical protein AURDEDRAFT_156874 [Auricularia subglabra TFB-10046 SS5]